MILLPVIPGRGGAASPEPLNTGHAGDTGAPMPYRRSSVFLGSGSAPLGHPGMTGP